MAKLFEHELDVVGLKFHCGKLEEREVLARQCPISGVKLVRDQENRWDENAIRVDFPKTHRGGKQMGFVPKESAAVLAPLMDRGALVFKSATLLSVNSADKFTTGRLALVFTDKR